MAVPGLWAGQEANGRIKRSRGKVSNSALISSNSKASLGLQQEEGAFPDVCTSMELTQ